MRDAELFRALADTRSGYVTTEEVVARPGAAERILELTAEPLPMPPGPSRAQLVELLAAAA